MPGMYVYKMYANGEMVYSGDLSTEVGCTQLFFEDSNNNIIFHELESNNNDIVNNIFSYADNYYIEYYTSSDRENWTLEDGNIDINYANSSIFNQPLTTNVRFDFYEGEAYPDDPGDDPDDPGDEDPYDCRGTYTFNTSTFSADSGYGIFYVNGNVNNMPFDTIGIGKGCSAGEFYNDEGRITFVYNHSIVDTKIEDSTNISVFSVQLIDGDDICDENLYEWIGQNSYSVPEHYYIALYRTGEYSSNYPTDAGDNFELSQVGHSIYLNKGNTTIFALNYTDSYRIDYYCSQAFDKYNPTMYEESWNFVASYTDYNQVNTLINNILNKTHFKLDFYDVVDPGPEPEPRPDKTKIGGSSIRLKKIGNATVVKEVLNGVVIYTAE